MAEEIITEQTLVKETMPDYNYHFHRDDLKAALACLDEYGFCVIQQLIDREMVAALKESIDWQLDPEGDLAPASNRYHMAFAEDSEPVWDLVENPDYKRFIHTVHGTTDLCLHRSAAILRMPGEGMGRWHQDHRGHIVKPQHANDVLNRYPIPSGCWFYLNGSHPDRSGIAVIEKSHHLEWEGPEGYIMGPNRSGLYPKGGTPDTPYDAMSVPGASRSADPGDYCFAALTLARQHGTHERRTLRLGFRPRTWRIDARGRCPLRLAWLNAPDHLKLCTEVHGVWGVEAEDSAESIIREGIRMRNAIGYVDSIGHRITG